LRVDGDMHTFQTASALERQINELIGVGEGVNGPDFYLGRGLRALYVAVLSSDLGLRAEATKLVIIYGSQNIPADDYVTFFFAYSDLINRGFRFLLIDNTPTTPIAPIGDCQHSMNDLNELASLNQWFIDSICSAKYCP